MADAQIVTGIGTSAPWIFVSMARPSATPQSAAAPHEGGGGFTLHQWATLTTATKYANPMQDSSAARCAWPKTRGIRTSEIAANVPAALPYHFAVIQPQRKTVSAKAAAEPTRRKP